MSKISIEEVESLLLEKKFDPIKVNEVVSDMKKIVEELSEDRKANSGKKPKWETVIVLHDKEGYLTGKEIAGWVVKQEEGEDANLIMAKLCDAAKTQNEAAKRKKSFLTNITELFEGMKPKFLKEKKVKIQTKELSRVLVTDGKMI